MSVLLASAWAYIMANPEQAIGGILVVAEAVTRLTPTKEDDGFVKRIGGYVDKVFKVVKFPNRLR